MAIVESLYSDAIRVFGWWEQDNWSINSRPNTLMLSLVKDIIEKRVPKEPIKLTYGVLIDCGWKYGCPECYCAVGVNENAEDYTQKSDYCSECGQLLKW